VRNFGSRSEPGPRSNGRLLPQLRHPDRENDSTPETRLPLLGDRGLARQGMRRLARMVVRVVGGIMVCTLVRADGQQVSEGLPRQTTCVPGDEERHQDRQDERCDPNPQSHRGESLT
jgi:hypothetical protein